MMKKNALIPAKHRDLPATIGFVSEIRDELRAEIRLVGHKVESVDHKVEALRLEMNSRFETMSSQIQQVLVAVHRTQALMEEQRGENKIVFDGIKSVMERQDRVEADVKEVKETIRTLARTKRSLDQ